jgi:shikimate kinase
VSSRRPLALIGFMGAGKSAVGAIVAERAHVPFHDLDQMIVAEAGLPVAGIFAERGEKGFRELEKRLLPEAIEPGAVAALGGGAVVDEESWRTASSRAMTVYLDVPFDKLWGRLQHEIGRPLIAGRSREVIEALFESRRSRYLEAERRVDGDREPVVVADEVLKIWSA